jgi:hypothetical protein
MPMQPLRLLALAAFIALMGSPAAASAQGYRLIGLFNDGAVLVDEHVQWQMGVTARVRTLAILDPAIDGVAAVEMSYQFVCGRVPGEELHYFDSNFVFYDGAMREVRRTPALLKQGDPKFTEAVANAAERFACNKSPPPADPSDLYPSREDAASGVLRRLRERPQAAP